MKKFDKSTEPFMILKQRDYFYKKKNYLVKVSCLERNLLLSYAIRLKAVCCIIYFTSVEFLSNFSSSSSASTSSSSAGTSSSTPGILSPPSGVFGGLGPSSSLSDNSGGSLLMAGTASLLLTGICSWMALLSWWNVIFFVGLHTGYFWANGCEKERNKCMW